MHTGARTCGNSSNAARLGGAERLPPMSKLGRFKNGTDFWYIQQGLKGVFRLMDATVVRLQESSVPGSGWNGLQAMQQLAIDIVTEMAR